MTHISDFTTNSNLVAVTCALKLTMSETKNVCAVCKIPAMQLCSGCKSVYYCNREHQKKHWKEGHKNNCALYKIATSKKFGQHLIAVRDIKQNEVILKEIPLVLGPHSLSLVTCLGCNRRIRDKQENVYKCVHCNWPLCGKKCQDTSLHKAECKLMKENDFKANITYTNSEKVEAYNVIAPLRCLLLKPAKSKYNTLISLPSRSEHSASERRNEKIKTSVVPFIQDILKLNFTEEEIVEAACIFDTNSLDVTKDDGDINIKGLYPTTALLKQDCNPNTKHIFCGNNLQLTLIATVPIAKGDIITTTHTEILWGTLARRASLKETIYIDCDCRRCSDKTELGTYIGAIFCCKCKKPIEECCPKMLSTDPLNPTAIWKCEKCDHTIRGRQMVWGNDAIKSELNRIGKNPLNLEQFLVKYNETLHAKNYHSLIAKHVLCQTYGNVKGYTFTELTDEIIERKIDVCHELLEVADVLSPGFSTLRGSLLYDLQAAMAVQAKRDFNKGKVTKAAAQETVTESMVILKEAALILSAEPDMKEFLQEKLEALVKELDFDE